ncbi:MAG: extracellular solute-binding protein [Lachnospiraceae bacterium]|nr:extracellular solute-binding protein [Lachnospiraceae bacterium]
MRMKWKKTLSAFFIGTSLLTLTGCHGSKALPEFTMPEEFDASKNYEITFWAKNDTNKNQTAVYKKAITDFEALYPNIKVNMKLYTDYGRIFNDVITNIATGTTPNVCITYPDHIATYMTGKNTVVPLDALFSDDKYGLGGSSLRYDGPAQEEIVPQFLSECVLEEQHYAIPYMRSTECCYINKDYVEKLGYTLPDVLTWDFIWEVSEAATAKNEDGTFALNGQNVMIPFIYKSTDNMMIQTLKQQGADYSTPEGDIGLFNDTTEAFLYEIADHVESGAFSPVKISSDPANFLNAGQCVFAIDSTAGATWMGADAPLSDISEDAFVDFETAVRMVPQTDPENPQMISQGPSVCVFNKADPQEVLASWLFAQYLLTDEVQIGYAQTEGYLPVTLKAQESPVYQDYLRRRGEDNQTYYDIKIDASTLLLAHTGDTFVTPVFNGSASLRNAAGQLIENVATSVRRHETVDDAFMERLYADVTALYRLDQKDISTDGKALGPLPQTAVLLLGALALSWCLILLCVLSDFVKKRKKH